MQVHTDRPKLVATLGDWDRLNLSTANIKLGVNRKHSEPDSKAGHLFHIATFPCSMFSIQRVLIEKNNTGFCTTLNVNIKDIPFFMAIINNKNKPKFSVYNIMRNYTHSEITQHRKRFSVRTFLVLLGSMCAPCSSVAHIQSTPLSPVLSVTLVHVTNKALNRPNNQVVHCKSHNISNIKTSSSLSTVATPKHARLCLCALPMPLHSYMAVL